MTKYSILYFLTIFYSCSDNTTNSGSNKQDTLPLTQETKPVMKKKLNDKEFITEFAKLGYFDYTEKSKLNLIKDSLKKHFNGDKIFFTEFNSKPPYQFYDSRFYSCGNGEELYEEGGAVSLIQEMQPFLNKIGVQLNYSNDNYTNGIHTISVNGTNYFLAQGSPLLWGETVHKFAEMLNAELEKHNSKERVYLMTYENEYMIFMTQEQYRLVCEYFTSDKRPLTVSDWTTKTLNEFNKIFNQ